MKFEDPQPPITLEDLSDAEAELGLKLPADLKATYLKANGGQPNPYVFENEDLDTVVNEFLALRQSTHGRAEDTYRLLVRDRRLVPANFFPFAVDGAGDYFFVDTATDHGAVYFYRSDSPVEDRLRDLKVGVREFWSRLKAEDA